MTQGMHPVAARGFDATAEIYERSRPDYPAEAVAAIVEALGLGPRRTVLDLAAGTGKLTRLLVPTGAWIIAVEPLAGMRAVLQRLVPGVDALEGTAEDIPLPAASVDGVVVAQAAHWFDAVRATSELHRVLRPGGRLAMIWNRRGEEEVAWLARLGELVEQYTGAEMPRDQPAWRPGFERSALFGPVEMSSYAHVHRLTVQGVVERVQSISTVAVAPPEAQAGLEAAIRELLATDPVTAGRDLVDMPYETSLFVAERRSIEPGREGIVSSVNQNEGGVPKPPVDRARVLRLGLDGDSHHSDVHGGERAAVCLYPQEAIERVRADGHQAFPGSYGENLTLLGVDWLALGPGDRVVVGDGEEGPLLELTQYATPCDTQARWFTGGRIGRISHAAYPEDARWYARVLREGDVKRGDAVRVLARD